MTTRTYESKNGEIWTWEETPEVVKAIENYWNMVKSNEQKTTDT